MLTVVDRAGAPVSSVLSFYFRDEVLPYYAGDHERARALAANDFKYWELMRRAVERGLHVFDYGRSKRGTGSFDFKKNWGFEPQPLHYEYLLLKRDGIPQNNPANPKYRAFIEAVAAAATAGGQCARAFDRAQPGLMRAMEPLLYLVHRIPFPPNKGDKIRSYHLLRHLAERYAVHLGTFVDMPEDLAHVPQLEALCASHRVETLDPRAGAVAQRRRVF